MKTEFHISTRDEKDCYPGIFKTVVSLSNCITKYHELAKNDSDITRCYIITIWEWDELGLINWVADIDMESILL